MQEGLPDPATRLTFFTPPSVTSSLSSEVMVPVGTRLFGVPTAWYLMTAAA